MDANVGKQFSSYRQTDISHIGGRKINHEDIALRCDSIHAVNRNIPRTEMHPVDP